MSSFRFGLEIGPVGMSENPPDLSTVPCIRGISVGPEFPSNAMDGPFGNNANQLPRDANNLGIENRDDLPLLQSEADIQMTLTLQRRELARTDGCCSRHNW